MRFARFVIVVLAVASCKKTDDKPAPAPAPAPAGSAGSMAAPTPSAGAGSAASGSSAAGAPPACAVVQVTVDVKEITLKRDVEVKASPDKLDAALRDLAKTCIGRIDFTPTGEAAFQNLVTAMDAANRVGFRDVTVGGAAPGGTGAAAPELAASKHATAKTPVIIVTKTAVTLRPGDKPVAAVDAADLGAKLTEALKAITDADPPGVVVIQADQATKGGAIMKIVDAAHAAHYDDVLFAVKSK